MKLLTAITILLTIPTLISSLWGMNVYVPMQDLPYAFVEIEQFDKLGIFQRAVQRFLNAACRAVDHFKIMQILGRIDIKDLI